jgi:acetyl coenzyme A synthetase (ADP forming)-like protein
MAEPAVADPSRSLDPIFSPRSIAVIGASRDRGSIGFALLHNLVMGEFQGAIYPINPHADAIHSLKAYPRVSDVPDVVDLAVVAVPRDRVPGVVRECLARGVRGLVIITAGFGETGDEGRRMEAAIREMVRRGGARMVGPNCMGVINTDAAVTMNATFSPAPARAGSVAFVSQSGALGVAILLEASHLGIGLTQFVSMGNKADVSGNDLLEYWEDDPATRVICMYLESFGNPRRFTEIAKRVGRKKPILVVKSGRTEEGARAATSHTGAIAGRDITVSAFLGQCGILRANTIAELFDMVQAFDRCPLPAGDRVAVVTNAGGPAIMATDACVNLGLRMARFSDETRQRLAEFLPSQASLDNPVDMIASANRESYRRTLDIVMADEGVDMVLAINVTPLLTRPTEVIEAMAEASALHAAKPLVSVMMATEGFYEENKSRTTLPPIYRFPEPAARALSQLWRYAGWRQRPIDDAPPAFEVDDEAVEKILDRVPDGYLPAAAAYRVLEIYGIPAAPWAWATHPEETSLAAERIGFPVVLKAEAPQLVHKSDIGAVRVGLANADAVRTAADEMVEALDAAGHAVSGFLVQRHLKQGHEVIFGLSSDPRFGPVLMFGLGGRYVEVFNDVRFGVTPLTELEAREMITGIRGFKLLSGVRGEAAADLDVLTEVQLRIAQLSVRHPRILELDINPFLAASERDAARAVDVRIRVGEPGG